MFVSKLMEERFLPLIVADVREVLSSWLSCPFMSTGSSRKKSAREIWRSATRTHNSSFFSSFTRSKAKVISSTINLKLSDVTPPTILLVSRTSNSATTSRIEKQSSKKPCDSTRRTTRTTSSFTCSQESSDILHKFVTCPAKLRCCWRDESCEGN